MKKIAYARYGVILGQGQAPVGISAAYIDDAKKVLTFEGNTAEDLKLPFTKLNIFQQSGTMYFRSKGVDYTVRELRDNDGIWLSRFGILLPEDALSALIEIGGQVDTREQFTAMATDDSPYVVAVLYSNASGRYARVDGEWIKTAQNDSTFNSMIPMAIEPAKAREFLDLYDENFVSVSDAQGYEISDDVTAIPSAEED